ncbi:MAG: phosphoenolpyruvate synthase/pyruvate phosphate dikinase [Desulfobacterales bacterium]|nr:phosphoenolpyruvate synthase/pyruvate phosphate dikinase [Desulfobacterales bacterium]
MDWKVEDILLISTQYNAWIMEEDARLSERIIHEYRGLNLSHPPRLTWSSSAAEALESLGRQNFDLVIIMPPIPDMEPFILGEKIKQKVPGLPVILLTQHVLPARFDMSPEVTRGIDQIFFWSGNTDILVALVKNTEDRVNVSKDIEKAGVRIILMVEDSPSYASIILPLLYKEIVKQAQAVMEDVVNEEHRLLTMRTRPKILLAENYEDALHFYERYEEYIIGVISDTRIPKHGELDSYAGIDLLSKIKERRFDIPLLLTSTQANNREKAGKIPASFVDKNSSTLLAEIHSFILESLGFGDFVFRSPDGKEVARSSNLRSFENNLYVVPDESILYHWLRNDFSRWLFARSEILLATRLRPANIDDFSRDIGKMRQYLISNINARRKWRQKGVVVDFDAHDFEPEMDFIKMGKGSLGGKARGLAFATSRFHRNQEINRKYPEIRIYVPQTLVITTDGFDNFIEENNLAALSRTDITDEKIAKTFMQGNMPQWIEDDLRAYLLKVHYPLAIRSSSLFEDGQIWAYAGLYSTCMIPNDDLDLEARLEQLMKAVKYVYASTYFAGPRAFAKRVGHHIEEEKMAVIIQQLVGERFGEYFYPSISGVAQSHNYYPFSHMKPEDGIATIGLGLGRIVMEGEKTLRFSPKHPQILPQRSTVDDILKNAQRYFYALKIGTMVTAESVLDEEALLEKREVSDALDELPIKLLSSTYFPAEGIIRDTSSGNGAPVLTFAQVLKHKTFPLAEILDDVLKMMRNGMGCPVEIEFSVNLCTGPECLPEFAFLQTRPMTARAEMTEVDINQEDIDQAVFYSTQSLGNGIKDDIADIIYIKPDVFEAGKTPRIAMEIGKLNAKMLTENKKYMLVGPGRWGSTDRWLGIPVKWPEISGVNVMVETAHPELNAEPSQGSHFFHNVTTLGITYLNIGHSGDDFVNWDWLTSLPVVDETPFLAHAKLDKPFVLKADGRTTTCVIVP